MQFWRMQFIFLLINNTGVVTKEERAYIFPHDQKVKLKNRPMVATSAKSVYGKVGINQNYVDTQYFPRPIIVTITAHWLGCQRQLVEADANKVQAKRDERESRAERSSQASTSWSTNETWRGNWGGQGWGSQSQWQSGRNWSNDGSSRRRNWRHMQSAKLTILASAALVRGAEATELPDTSFLYFAAGVFTVGAIIGFLMGIIVMLCLRPDKKDDSSPKLQKYLPEATPCETKPQEQDCPPTVSDLVGGCTDAQALVTKNGWDISKSYHTTMCRAMYSKQLDANGNKIPYSFTRLQICKNCAYLEKQDAKRTKKE